MNICHRHENKFRECLNDDSIVCQYWELRVQLYCGFLALLFSTGKRHDRLHDGFYRFSVSATRMTFPSYFSSTFSS